ncbi:hypothetical protein OG589_17125 [Sphaerisporangium sp. NBC_01403]|uniref:hypothetical protein n=1 Tax=Sphaerisporangium sp. NBC_01403 TaxID=2903599 RepID=UPI00324830E0
MLAVALAGGLLAVPAQALSPQQDTVTEMPDRHSALEAAQRQGERVEIWSLRDDRSTTYANPDGSLRTEFFSGPIRAEQDGSLKPIDTTLVEQDGVLRPRVAQADVEFSNGGSAPLVKLGKGRVVRRAVG